MKCTKCGAEIPNGAGFCAQCGQAVKAPAAAKPAAAPAAAPKPAAKPAAQQQPQPQAEPKAKKAAAPPPEPEEPAYDAEQDAKDGKLMAILAYILFFIPMIAGAHKTSPFVKFHTNQGLLLFIASVALGVAISIIQAILRVLLFNIFAWGLYGVLSTILSILWLAPTALLIIGIINAAGGSFKPLPVIGDKITIIK